MYWPSVQDDWSNKSAAAVAVAARTAVQRLFSRPLYLDMKNLRNEALLTGTSLMQSSMYTMIHPITDSFSRRFGKPAAQTTAASRHNQWWTPTRPVRRAFGFYRKHDEPDCTRVINGAAQSPILKEKWQEGD